MATKAYVLIETSVGKTRMWSHDGVRIKAYGRQTLSLGRYDVIAVVEAEDLNAVGDLVTSRIQTLEGIVKTMTCLCGGRD